MVVEARVLGQGRSVPKAADYRIAVKEAQGGSRVSVQAAMASRSNPRLPRGSSRFLLEDLK